MSQQNITELDRKRLFWIGQLSIFTIGLAFAIRATIAPDLQTDIYNQLDLANSAAMVGEALGLTFAGFAFTLLFGSALVDWMGMKKMLLLSALGYVLGSILILVASLLPVTPFVSWLVLAVFAMAIAGLFVALQSGSETSSILSAAIVLLLLISSAWSFFRGKKRWQYCLKDLHIWHLAHHFLYLC